jgi:xylulokinase
MNPLFLGLDSSTQSLTAVLVDLEERQIVAERSVHFDTDLPHWGTRHGQLPNEDPRVGQAPPLMWVEALDVLLGRMAGENLPLGRIAALAVSAQQHGTVYLRAEAENLLAGLSALPPEAALPASLEGALSRKVAPIWTDASTTQECAEIRKALGGTAAAARLTGSDVFERFASPQIRRFARLNPEAYRSTAHIALVSSFLTSVLAGRLAPIDHADGSGMNLLDLERRQWSGKALEATAPALGSRLLPAAPSSTVVGPVAPWLVQRHGLPSRAQVVVGCGDNPSSLVGTGLVSPGDAAVSLGTSDTFFFVTRDLRCDSAGSAHVFLAPTGDPMTLLCFSNGSLARERIRDRFGLDWAGFSAALRTTEPGNGGRLLLPWFETEIVPRGVQGVRYLGGLAPDDGPANCRAVVEAQILSMCLHSQFLDQVPKRLVVTGGGSRNREILQVVADVFGCPVSVVDTPQSAALGAALRAAQALRLGTPEEASWSDLVRGFDRAVMTLEPRTSTRAAYDRLLSVLSGALE